METREVGEKRQFKAHEKLLLDVIQRQAGSLSKGLLESVMNAVDAKATFVNIRLDHNSVLISDDGKGFGSKEQLIHVFEVFGQPHDDSEDKVYGAFRCGRGQMFCYGHNDWRTGEYRMIIDIKNRGLTYELLEKQRKVAGCQIRVKLYDDCSEMDQLTISRDLERWCRYAPIKVYLNDKLISTDPANHKWDHVTDDAYIRLTQTGSLTFYNLGIHVCEFANYKYGTGGVVVSRKQLKVNFARNDIQSDCTVWKRIKPMVDQIATRNNVEKKVLDDGARQRLADQICTGQLKDDYSTTRLKLITAVTGRQYSLDTISHERTLSNAPRGDVMGDRLMRQKLAFIIADETLENFNVETAKDLYNLLKRKLPKATEYWSKPTFKLFTELTEGMDDKSTILLENELKPSEVKWLALLQKASSRIRLPADSGNPYGKYVYGGWADGRRLCIGQSEVADGWTDGSSYVALSRAFLAKNQMDIKGITNVLIVLCHEACHYSPDNVDHDHDQEFYESFHDMIRQCLGSAVADALTFLPEIVKRTTAKLTKKDAKTLDKIKKAEKQLEG